MRYFEPIRPKLDEKKDGGDLPGDGGKTKETPKETPKEPVKVMEPNDQEKEKIKEKEKEKKSDSDSIDLKGIQSALEKLPGAIAEQLKPVNAPPSKEPAKTNSNQERTFFDDLGDW